MNTNAVVLAADRRYMPAAMFVAQQALQQTDRSYDILILSVDANDTSCLDGVRIVDAGKHLRDRLPLPAQVRAAMYARLYVDELLPDRYGRILYLDCDVWIATSRLGALFTVDMSGYPFAAVRDNYDVFNRNGAFDQRKVEIGMDAASPYFNSGVMLIDRQRWCAMRIAENANEYLLRRPEPEHQDQTVLNAVVNGSWLELSPRWNWTHAPRIRLTERIAPAIIHFIGSSKPWKDLRARYPAHYARAMCHFYASIGQDGYFSQPTRLTRARRMASRKLRELRPFDRREKAILTHMYGKTFADDGILA